MAEKNERIYTVPLRKAFDYSHKKRARKAVKLVSSFVSRHMKAPLASVRISEGVNSAIWKRGISSPPRRIKIRAVREGDKVTAYLMDEKPGEAKAKKEKKKGGEKKPEGKKEEKKEPEKKPEPEEKEPEKK